MALQTPNEGARLLKVLEDAYDDLVAANNAGAFAREMFERVITPEEDAHWQQQISEALTAQREASVRIANAHRDLCEYMEGDPLVAVDADRAYDEMVDRQVAS